MNNLIESINKPVSQMVKTKYLFKRYERHIEAATIAFNAGEFTSKSAQKKALDSLSQCFDSINALDGTNEELYRKYKKWAIKGVGCFLEVPFSLHHIREKHFVCYSQVNWKAVKELVSMREAIKAMPVNRPVKGETFATKTRSRIEKSLLEILKLRQTQFAGGVELVEIFGKLPVYGNTHFCMNQHGTSYTRTFWYMNYKLTPLSVILCVLEATKKEEESS